MRRESMQQQCHSRSGHSGLRSAQMSSSSAPRTAKRSVAGLRP
eukprot:COSAG06_NODE_628_length_13649_cov_20.848930_6_plen_43_part_00